MARSRLLKPGFFANELLAELPFEARLCFAGLWTLADREGRLEDRPKRIGAALFPYDAVDIVSILAALDDKGFIVRYQVGAIAVISIPTFKEHQSPHMRENASILPSRDEHQTSPVLAPVEAQPRSPCTVSVSVPVSIPVCESPVLVPALPDTHTDRPRGATFFSGKDHLAHAACGRVCVPAFLHREFVRALGGHEDASDGRLRDWYTAVLGALDEELPVESDAPKFWRPRFQGTFIKPGGVAAVYASREAWVCPHVDECESPTICANATYLNRPLKAMAS